MKQSCFFCLLILIFSCGPAKKVAVASVATPLPAGTQVEVMGQGQKIPYGAKFLGKLSVVDGGFSTKCTYDVVLSNAQNQARGMGGDIVQITKHKEPSVWSTCHQIWCDVYKK